VVGGKREKVKTVKNKQSTQPHNNAKEIEENKR
jgi:hypothetical protein